MHRRMIPAVLAALASGAIPATASADTITLNHTYNSLLCGVWNNLPAEPATGFGPPPGPTTCSPSSDYSQVGVALGSFHLQPLNPLTEPVAVITQQVTNTTPTPQSQTVTYSQSLTQSNSLTTTVGVGVSASSTEEFNVLLAKVSETVSVMANFSQAIGYSSSQSKTFTDATTITVPPGCTYTVSSWIEQATYSPTYTATVLLTGTANNSVLVGDTRSGLGGPYSLSMQTLANDLQYYANAPNWPALYGYTNVNVGGLAGDPTFQSGLSDLSQAGWNYNAGANAIVGNVSGVWNGLEGTQADSSYYIDKCNGPSTDRAQAANARGPRLGYHRRASRHGGLLMGSSGPDLLEGGPGADHIVGRGGGDLIFAGPGNDTVDAGGRNDHVDGGPGNDTIRLKSYDSARGGPGNDLIDGSGGHNLIHGGPGNDRIILGPGDLAFGDGGANTFVIRRLGAPAMIEDLKARDTVDLSDPQYRSAFLRWRRDPRIVQSWDPAPTSTAPTMLVNLSTGIVAFDPDGTGPRRALAAFRDMSGLDFKVRRITVFAGRPVHVDRVDRGTTHSTSPPVPPTARRSG